MDGGRRAMLMGLGVAAGLYSALVGALYLFQRDLLFLPDTGRPSLAAAGVPGLREAEVATEDGLKLLSWWLPPSRSDSPVVLYLHGNGGHVGYRAGRAAAMAREGWGLLLVGYRGYGGNPGRPSEDGLALDALGALAFLAGQGVETGRVVLFGESLGTGVAVRLAAGLTRPDTVAAVVLESPYTSIADVAQHHYPFVPAWWLVADRFDAATRIAAVDAPVLVLHGEADNVVPVRFGRRLFEAAAEPKEARFFPGAGHNELFRVGAFDAVRDFVGRHVRAGARP